MIHHTWKYDTRMPAAGSLTRREGANLEERVTHKGQEVDTNPTGIQPERSNIESMWYFAHPTYYGCTSISASPLPRPEGSPSRLFSPLPMIPYVPSVLSRKEPSYFFPRLLVSNMNSDDCYLIRSTQTYPNASQRSNEQCVKCHQ